MTTSAPRPTPPASTRPEVTPPDRDAVVRLPRPVDVAATLSVLGHGRADPCHRVAGAAVWRTSSMPGGPATYRVTQHDRDSARVLVWGPGADDVIAGAAALLGTDDDPTGFDPDHPGLAEAHRRNPGLRIPRTGRVLESLVPAVLEQRVHGASAFASWRRLVDRFGEPAPGPAPDGMRVPPTAEVWRRVPSWDFHRANVDPGRARTIVRCAQVADSLERLVDDEPAVARRRLRAVPGIGVWTAAEVASRALGDADALSVGDYHLATTVGWALAGRPLDDAGMIALLAPLRPHRQRAVRLLEYTGGRSAVPRRGPRTPLVDHRHH